MALTLQDVDDLLSGERDPIRVGEIPYDIAIRLKLKNHNVYLSKLSLLHIFEEHADINRFTLLSIPFALRDGLLIQERKKPHIIVSSHLMEVTGKRHMTIMKITAEGTEIWVSTFHRAHARQTVALLKRGIILQSHK